MRVFAVSHCSVKQCPESVTVIIHKTIGNDQDVYFGYCQFHSIIANGFFPPGNNREEVKGLKL